MAIIQNPNVPVGAPALVRPPESVPGTLSAFTGMAVLFGMLRRGVDAALDYRSKHGDVYKISLGGSPSVGIWDADTVHAILRNEDKAWSTALGWEALMFRGLDDRGNVGGLLAMDFEDHRLARKVVAPAFTTRAIDGYLATAHRHFARANSEWVARGHVGFKSASRRLLSQVAGEIFTGITDPEEMAVIDRALTAFWYVQHALSRNAWLSPTFRRAREGLRTLLDVLGKLMSERRAAPGNDLLSQLVTIEDREGLGDDDILRLFVNIIGAAFDTTSAGLTSMAYLVARHPEWQEKLREEARAVGDEPLDAVRSREMKLHEMVWKETLRLFPVAGFLPRRALREVEVCGHRLASGTLVFIAPGALGRHPKWWTEPSSFDPERFSPERAEDKKHPAIFNPFGGGAHVCIGAQLATMEVKAYWHDMFRRCRLRLKRDEDVGHSAAPLGVVAGPVDLVLEHW